jgi:hypothetical protein
MEQQLFHSGGDRAKLCPCGDGLGEDEGGVITAPWWGGLTEDREKK